MAIVQKNKTLSDIIQRKRGVSRNSARTWASTLRRINREFSDEPWNINLKWLKDESILAKMKKLNNLTIKKNLGVAAVTGLLILNEKALKKKYSEWLLVVNLSMEKDKKNQLMSDRQKKNYIDWKDIVKLRGVLAKEAHLKKWFVKKLSKKEFMKLQRLIVLSLYTENSPIRLDFAEMRVIGEKEFKKLKKSNLNTNFFVLQRGKYKFYFWKFKTAKFHDLPVVIGLSKKLVTILKKYANVLKRRFGDEDLYLLYNSQGKPMNRNSLSKFLTSTFVNAFDKRISASMLRTIFLSHKYRETDILEREATAHDMLHSRRTAEMHYIKKIDQ